VRRLVLSKRAEREIGEVLRWTEERLSLSQREQYEALLSERLKLLASEPELGKPAGSQ
jgi:plasmid stabilization system protein ParE